MCVYCLHHEVVTDKNHESPACGKHSGVCVTHADNSNLKKLKYTTEKLSKRGLEFAIFGIFGLAATSGDQVNTALLELEKQINKELVPIPDGQPMFMLFCSSARPGGLWSSLIVAAQGSS